MNFAETKIWADTRSRVCQARGNDPLPVILDFPGALQEIGFGLRVGAALLQHHLDGVGVGFMDAV